MGRFLNQIGRSLNILEAHIGGTRDVDEHAVGAVDGGLHQRACHRQTGGLFRLALAGRMADTHVGIAGILHNAGNIGEVQIDKAGIFDQIRNAGNGLMQNIVRDLEGVGQGNFLIGSVFQPVIRDDQQRVHLAEQLFDAGLGLIHSPLALKLEGLGYDTDGKHAGVSGNIRNGRCGTCSGSAAHTGRDKHHIGIFKSSLNGVAAFFRSTSADRRIGSGTLSAGDLFTDLNLLVGIRDGKRLFIGIDGDELDTLGAALHHAVDNIVSGSAYTDDFYRNDIFRSCFGLEIHTMCLLSESITQ